VRISDNQAFLSAVGRVACLEVDTADSGQTERTRMDAYGEALLLPVEIVSAKEAMIYVCSLRKTSRLLILAARAAGIGRKGIAVRKL